MIIFGDNLRLHYWVNSKRSFGYENYKEIEKGQYGYALEPGQVVAEIRYDESNALSASSCEILDATESGVMVSGDIFDPHKRYLKEPKPYPYKNTMFLPWEKDLPNGGKLVKCKLHIIPCEHLHQYWPIEDVLSGNVSEYDYLKNGQENHESGRGIWHQHGGRRTISSYDGNLKNFIKIGQMSILGG